MQPTKKNSDSNIMNTISLNLATSILTAIVTASLGAYYTASESAKANERSDRQRFVDGAQQTAQETTQLLIKSYEELQHFNDAARKFEKGWDDFLASEDFTKFSAFEQEWHKNLIALYFKVSRYYGKATAQQLLSLANFKLNSPDSHSKESRDQESSLMLAWGEAFRANASTVILQGEATKFFNNKSSVFDNLGSVMKETNEAKTNSQRATEIYGQHVINFLGILDSNLTQLGALEVKVASTPSTTVEK